VNGNTRSIKELGNQIGKGRSANRGGAKKVYHFRENSSVGGKGPRVKLLTLWASLCIQVHSEGVPYKAYIREGNGAGTHIPPGCKRGKLHARTGEVFPLTLGETGAQK